jgi:hypothetical protein
MDTDTRESRRTDRREFVNAVAEHLWVRPGTDRPTVKPPIVLLLTALVAACAVATGLILHVLHRNDPKPAASPPAPPPVTAAAWTAVAGWDCAADSGHGFTAVGRTSAWYTVPTGGWNQDGCDGSFAAVPMSGTGKDDPGQYALWWFQPGPAYGSCALAAYSPRPLRLQDAAATAVHFTVHSGQGGGTPMADVTVDQPAAAGRWTVLGTFPAGQQGLSVRLADRGTPPIPGGRIAMTQFRAVCTAR